MHLSSVFFLFVFLCSFSLCTCQRLSPHLSFNRSPHLLSLRAASVTSCPRFIPAQQRASGTHPGRGTKTNNPFLRMLYASTGRGRVHCLDAEFNPLTQGDKPLPIRVLQKWFLFVGLLFFWVTLGNPCFPIKISCRPFSFSKNCVYVVAISEARNFKIRIVSRPIFPFLLQVRWKSDLCNEITILESIQDTRRWDRFSKAVLSLYQVLVPSQL